MSDEILTRFVEIKASNISLAGRKTVCGVGTNDALYQVQPIISGKQVTCMFYSVWNSMMKRCYSKKRQEKYPTYRGCSVAGDWLLFSNFRKWMKGQAWHGKELDKDILSIGNKVYGPDTCVFVSRHVNGLLNDSGRTRGKHPQGVSFHKERKKFEANCRADGKRKYLGRFATAGEAEKVYKTAKSKEIKRVADMQTDLRVRDGLYRHADALS